MNALNNHKPGKHCAECSGKCLFFNKDGTLTKHALKKGHMEHRKTMSLYLAESGIYIVKGKFANRDIVEGFYHAKDARRYFRRFPKK